MSFASISFSTAASDKLRSMQGRTGITPNLLVRMGFCLSLRDHTPVTLDEPIDNARTIERRVLTGIYDELLLTLLRQRSECARLNEDKLVRHFKAHMYRGVDLLAKQLHKQKSLDRLPFLLPKSARSEKVL